MNKTAQVLSIEDRAKVFAGLTTAKLEGTKLWQTEGDVYTVPAEAKVSQRGNMYVVFDKDNTEEGKDTFINASGTLYDDVSTLPEGELVVNIQVARPIAGVTDEQLQEAYGPESTNPQPAAIRNYKQAIKQGAIRFMLQEIVE